jgi:hypothetical protein
LVAALLQWLLGPPRSSFSTNPVIWLAQMALIGAVFAVCFSVLCGPPIKLIWRRLKNLPPAGLAAVVVLAGFGGGALALLAAAATLGLAFDGLVWGQRPFWTYAVLSGAAAAGIALAISQRERLKAERDAADARATAAALTAQIRPHFLFNTLNAIAAQVRLDPTAAQENLARLAEMFRYTMKQAGRSTVSFADELALAREYLLLEKTRYGDNLRFELPEAIDLPVPPLTLQPLVENAVRHGIAKRRDGGCVQVGLAHRGDGWFLIVRNPTEDDAPIADERIFREGHALWILRSREQELRVRQPDGSFEVEVRLA